jgi:glutamate synthase (ferredoxin)
MVGLERVTESSEAADLRSFIERHAELTGSARAREVLADWDNALPKFVKVMPKDYKRVLEAIAKAQASGLTGEEAINAAFEANSRDTSRVGGN